MTNTGHKNVASPAPVRTFLRRAQYALFFLSVLALTYSGFVLLQTRIYQAYQSRQLEFAPKLKLAAPPAGHVIGKVKISRVGLEAVFVQGDSDSILRLAVGHIPGTAMPGQSGNMVLAGHRDTFFRALRNVRVGDRIVIEGPDGSYNYKVDSTSIVPPTDLSVLRHSGNRELTLITCYPFSWVGSAPDRFIVRASQDNVQQSAPLSRPYAS
jgi:LPXTG-site transpeptidase (sortase) family protein